MSGIFLGKLQMEQYLRRVPNPSKLDYYIYSEYLTENQIEKLIELDVLMFDKGREVMYIFSEAALTRQEWIDSRGKDMPLSIYKLPRGFGWRDMGYSKNYVNLTDKEIFVKGDEDDEAKLREVLVKTFSLDVVNE
jgi:hypothetical protein